MRKATPWYRKQTDSWYVWIGEKQQNLGKHPEGAPAPKKGKTGWNWPPSIDAAFRRLKDGKAEVKQTEGYSVEAICDMFLDYCKKHSPEKQYKWYYSYLQDLCDMHGKMAATALKPYHITVWLDSHETWKTSRRHAVTAVKRVFNWATDEGLLEKNPIKGVKKPPAVKRVRILTPQEREEILAEIKDNEFREFVFAMQETGCRPSEVSSLTAANVNLELGVWVIEKHKTAGKTAKPRIVFLTDAMLELSRKLVEKYPEGLLFRGPRGGTFKVNSLTARFSRLQKKLPHIKNAVAYAARHNFITDALQRGVGIAQVAELVGHTTTEIISRNYSHIAEDVAYMREQANKAAGEKPA